MTTFKGLVKKLLRSREVRKTPEQYRAHVVNSVTDPLQLSERTISEYYTVPSVRYRTPDDVFEYRGYKKLEKIDEGAFGFVSKAIRVSDNMPVAVKEIDMRRRHAKRIEEMKRELFVLQKISHETVVGLIEHFIAGQTLVIVMEYLAGNNLTLFLRDNALNEDEALGLFKQMATSVKVLHKKGIAHRDIKLNNFLLDGTHKIIKIADFGLSVVSFVPRKGILMAKTYCGTEPYMSPELFNKNHLNARRYNPLYADIWSLGVCLFAMLTRTFPFRSETQQDILFKYQLARRWTFPKAFKNRLTDDLRDIIWHMLDPEPERRITINGVLAHPWVNKNQFVALTLDEEPQPSTSGMSSGMANGTASGGKSVSKTPTTSKKILQSANKNTENSPSTSKNLVKSATKNIESSPSSGKTLKSVVNKTGSKRSVLGILRADKSSRGPNSASTWV